MIELNPAQRRLRSGDVLSACLIGKVQRHTESFGNGDCLLFDFDHRIFAVSDASERCPQASRRLLQALAVCACRMPWPDCLEAAWRTQPYVQKTTFVGVQIEMDPTPCARIVAGGDSMIWIVDRLNGKMLFRNAPDMHVAGGMSEMPGAIRVLLTPGSRIVLASDGIMDVLERNGEDGGMISGLAMGAAPMDWIGKIQNMVRQKQCRSVVHDDIAVMVIDPFKEGPAWPQILLFGGTSPHEEAHFAGSSLPGAWMTIEEAERQGWPETMGMRFCDIAGSDRQGFQKSA
ncbi:hypothetical protein [Desulfatirhabdium butyrativorans]|uniref:hypothetical protein n=1 Tax=Desulfatirhabdium butyrativorans TaxID=340467 RepID=UPI0003F5C54F|nr:hypothetical protein [Desulfatirhabdium butyrativorans]